MMEGCPDTWSKVDKETDLWGECIEAAKYFNIPRYEEEDNIYRKTAAENTRTGFGKHVRTNMGALCDQADKTCNNGDDGEVVWFPC